MNYLFDRAIKKAKLEDAEKQGLTRWVDTKKLKETRAKGYEIVRDNKGEAFEIKRVVLMVKRVDNPPTSKPVGNGLAKPKRNGRK